MSIIKNFGIAGVSSDLQLGKKGGRLIYDNGIFRLTGDDGTTISRVRVADAVESDEAVSLSQVQGLVNAVGDDLSDLQDELNDTQVGAGLENDGSYVAFDEYDESTAPEGAHYIHSATSLRDADKILDEEIKSLADALEALGEGDLGDIQDELDNIKGAVGLDSEGNFVNFSGTQYLDGSTSIVNALTLLDTALDGVVDGLGTIASQDADAVAITGGAIDGTVIGGTTAAAGSFTDLNASGDVVIDGDLTVNGDTVILDVTNLAVEDNVIRVNRGFEGDTTGVVSGIEVVTDQDTGDDVVGARWVYDLEEGKWIAQDADGAGWTLGTIEANIEGSVDFGFDGDSLVLGDGAELASGSEHQVLTVVDDGASGTELGYAYVGSLRNASGDVVVETAEADSVTGEYLDVDNDTDQVILSAKNATGSGDVDLILVGQGNGDVLIGDPNDPSILSAQNNQDLTVSGGDSDGSGAAGDLILKGGDGDSSEASGDVIIQGGTGGSDEGITIIRDSAGNTVATFEAGDASAEDFLTVKNGVGEIALEAQGEGTDIDMVLTPKGDGFILAPEGYDISSGPAEALAPKGYVDDAVQQVAQNVDPLVLRETFSADGVAESFTIGTMPNIAGKTYYVSRIVLHVGTSLSGNDIDGMVVTDGTTVLASATESDVEQGTYVIELPFVDATAGDSDIEVEFKDESAVDVAPTTGSVVAVVEYKVL